MLELAISLRDLLLAILDVFVNVVLLLIPLTPLFAWIAFWLFGVNWIKLRGILLKGGWVGLFLIGLVAIMVWGQVAPPLSGTHSIFGLHLSNFVGKTVYVTTLICIMLLCGSVQLSGCCAPCCNFEEETPEPETHGSGH